ncbi:MAG: hypothetical protein ACPGO5_00880 [Patescibacteria group bacterium]
MSEEMNTMKHTIESAIQDGSVRMKSKGYFVARSVALGIGLFILAAAIVYIVSFGMFVMYIRGGGELFAFGFPGMFSFIKSFPYILLGLAILLILIFELILKKQTISYRKPMILSVAVVVCLTLVVGFGFTKLPVHEYLYSRSISDTPTPLIGPIYKSFGDAPLDGVTPGVCLEVLESGFAMKTLDGEVVTVNMFETTRLSQKSPLVEGAQVMVLGELKDGVIDAHGVKVVPEDRPYAPFRKFKKDPRFHAPPPPEL